jgi:hypothetical protein
MKKTKNYGIITSGELPEGPYDGKMLPAAVKYAVTGDFASIRGVRNHCAATSAVNMIIYYAGLHQDTGFIRNGGIGDIKETFTAVHGYMHNGPVPPFLYRNRLSKYIKKETDYIAHTAVLRSWEQIKGRVAHGHMIYLLLWQGLSAHFVNVIGYREYRSGEKYVAIHDNWHKNKDHYVDFAVVSSWPNTFGYFYVSCK